MNRRANNKLRHLTAGIMVLVIVLMSDGAIGQRAAVGGVEATVQTGISITSSNNLDFGNVWQGVARSIAVSSSNAAVFQIVGQSQAGVELSLILPEYMSRTAGGDRMAVMFSSSDASIDTTASHDPTDAGISGWLGVNPYNLPSGALIGDSGTDLYIGGKVAPSINQMSGDYEGTIVLTVSYNGT